MSDGIIGRLAVEFAVETAGLQTGLLQVENASAKAAGSLKSVEAAAKTTGTKSRATRSPVRFVRPYGVRMSP